MQCPGLSVCHCTDNYTNVDCKGKHLLSVPELIPDTVETLELERNDFTNISTGTFQKWHRIKVLLLNFNKIAKIEPFAFKGLTSVRYLDLTSNQIKILENDSFAGLPNLEKLCLTTNKIQSIEQNAFRGTTSLSFIIFQKNKLSAVPAIGQQPDLTYLNFEGNRIVNATIPESYIVSNRITNLVLSNNKITTLEKRTFQAFAGASLKDLKIAKNKIQMIDSGTMQWFKSVRNLKIGDNTLLGMPEFNQLVTGLQDKDLQILDISGLDFGIDLSENTFEGLKDIPIKILVMKRCGIVILNDQVFKHIKYVIDLDLSTNEIRSISETAFDTFDKLTTLKLSGNRLGSIPNQLPSSLKVLYLDRNYLKKVEKYAFQDLPQLTELRLGFNSIQTLHTDSFHGLYNLKVLDLSNNNINTLPGKVFEQFVRLKSLNLAKNNLKTIQESNERFAAMYSLEYLNLADNQCSGFQMDLFQPLQNLKYLHLEENELGPFITETINGELFKGLGKLEEVYLMKNNITHIPSTLFKDQETLRVLNISHNDIINFGREYVRFFQTSGRLDMSYNRITSLNAEDFMVLDNKTSVNLMGNPFVCDCNIRGFLTWKNTSNVLLSAYSSYICNGPKEWAGKSLDNFSRSEINCIFYTRYALYVSLVLALVSSLVVYNIIYSKRWTIRLFRYRLVKRFKRLIARWAGVDGKLAQEGQFDAYVSVSEHDKDWALEHLLPGIDNGQRDDDHPFLGRFKLYYEDRDAIPGV